VGIGLVNAIGNVGGFIGPSLIGFLKKSTGHDNGAFFTLAAMALAAAAIIASMRRVPALARRSAVGTRPVEPVVVAAVPGVDA
jgi:nitrate/nitrite transporter NarK